MKTVTIISHSGDLHASHFCDIAISAKLDYRLVFTDRMASDGAICYSSDLHKILLKDVTGDLFDLNDSSAVWWRRISGVQQGHIVCEEYTDFVNSSWSCVFEGDLPYLCPNPTFVNSPAHTKRGYNKLSQLKLAESIGFLTPKTLISSDPSEVEKFVMQNDAIVKPMVSDSRYPVYVKPVQISDVRSGVSLAPTIYQQKIDSNVNYRVNVFGDCIYTFAITNPDLDWRIGGSKMEFVNLDANLEEKCREFIRKSDLVMGCIDLREDSDGEIYFLENNPQGQFDFIEGYTQYPLMRQFQEFLYSL